MSAAKTVIAALIGVAVQHGLFDIDTPIMQYGVHPGKGSNWSRTGVDFFPNVTARHLLSQSSGGGSWFPGTALTYDSDEYIQHLSYLLNATAGKNATARQWATSEFAIPLGLPQLYAYQGPDPAARGDTPTADEGGNADISAGGDQPMFCRDLARVGLLLANDGKWADADGKLVQLANADYVRAMFTPQDTHIPSGVGWGPGNMAEQYSLLSVIATDNSPLINKSACTVQNGGLTKVLGLPNGALLALGLMGRYLIVVPEEKLVVTFMGSNLAKMNCENNSQGTWSNFEGIILSQLWSILRPATLPVAPGHLAAERFNSEWPAETPTPPKTVKQAHHQRERRGLHQPELPTNQANPEGGHEPHHEFYSEAPQGSCYCYCGYQQAVGRCFNVSSEGECTYLSISQTAETMIDYCSRSSLLLDCFDAPTKCPETLYSGTQLSPMGMTHCPERAPPGPLMEAMQCHYNPVAFEECKWVTRQTCVSNPYFPVFSAPDE